MFFAPTGAARLVSGDFRDSGRYRISDDGVLCQQFLVVRAGAEACATYHRDGEAVFAVSPSSEVAPADTTGQPGNPLNL